MTYQTNKVQISDIIGKSFYKLHHSVKNNDYTHFWIKGGRGSCKSSFVSIEIVLGMMKHQNRNAVVLRKVGVNLKDSVFEQLKWAIEMLGVTQHWEEKVSPLSLTYIPTGQKILFRGGDDPKKIKSTKISKGYVGYLWYEEVDEFFGMEELRSINQSLLRGGDFFTVFYTFNPPKSIASWVNDQSQYQRADTAVFHSDYRSVPEKWLGKQFSIEAEYLKKQNPTLYKHEYLGIAVGEGGQVFKNVSVRKITDDEKLDFKTVVRGIDWGYAADPFVYVVAGYDNKKKRIYIYDEFFMVGAKFNEIIKFIKNENKNNNKIIADSAEPRSNDMLKENGIFVVPSRKGAGSVDFGISFLQNLESIVIDSEKCKNTAREFSNYHLEKDIDGNYKGGFMDKNNHTIDAIRYALNEYIKKTSFDFI